MPSPGFEPLPPSAESPQLCPLSYKNDLLDGFSKRDENFSNFFIFPSDVFTLAPGLLIFTFFPSDVFTFAPGLLIFTFFPSDVFTLAPGLLIFTFFPLTEKKSKTVSPPRDLNR